MTKDMHMDLLFMSLRLNMSSGVLSAHQPALKGGGQADSFRDVSSLGFCFGAENLFGLNRESCSCGLLPLLLDGINNKDRLSGAIGIGRFRDQGRACLHDFWKLVCVNPHSRQASSYLGAQKLHELVIGPFSSQNLLVCVLCAGT